MLQLTVQLLGAKGAGTSTLAGRLLYECDGVDMLMLERLDKKEQCSYCSVVPLMEKLNIIPTFKTITHEVKFVSDDGMCAILVVDATNFCRPDVRTIEILENAQRRVLVVNKMDAINWSWPVYVDIISQVKCSLGNIFQFNSIIAISALNGDNVVSKTASWNQGVINAASEKTVLDALGVSEDRMWNCMKA